MAMREGRSRRLGSAILLTAIAVFLSACVTVDEDSSGQEIYEQICSRCHGGDLGGGVGPALGADSDAAARDDGFWTQTITRGRGRMPAFRSTLSDEQIQRVIEYSRDVQGR